MGVFDLSHLQPLRPDEVYDGVSNTNVGWGEAFTSGFDYQRTNYSPLSLQVEVDNRWRANLELLSRLTGEEFSGPVTNNALTAYIQSVGEGTEPQSVMGHLSPQAQMTFDKDIAEMARANALIAELGRPEVKSFNEILQEVYSLQHDVEARQQEVSARSGIVGTVGGLAGQIAGSVNPFRDPVGTFSLPVGGFGRGLATKIATEMAIGAGAVAATNPEIRTNRELAGLPDHGMLQDVLVGGLAAGLFAAGGHALGRQVDNFFARREQAKFDASLVNTVLDTNPQSPRARAGLSFLDDSLAFEYHNPYGNTPAGRQQFEDDVADIHGIMSGKTDAAVAKTLSPVEYTPANLILNTELVKERSPAVFEAVATTQQRVAEIDARINELSNVVNTAPLSSTGLGELAGISKAMSDGYVDMLTEQAGLGKIRDKSGAVSSTLQVIKQVAERGIPVDRNLVETIARSVDTIDSKGKTRQAALKALVESTVAKPPVPKQTLSSLRKERRSAVAAYTRARNAFDAEAARIQAERELMERVYSKAVPTSDSAGTVSFDTNRLRPDVLEEWTVQVHQAAEQIDDVSKSVVDGMVVETEGGPPMIDLGNGQKVASDFVFDDPDGSGTQITAAELAAKLQDDEALLRAMTECAV